MDFYFETYYDHAALTAMAKALRKLMRNKRSTIVRILALIFVGFGIIMASPLGGREVNTSPSALLSYLALLFLLVSVFCEDMINGFFAQKRYVHSDDSSEAIFHEKNYEIRSDDGITFWQYHSIVHLAETRYFFIFVFNENHAQAFDKDGLSSATAEEFRTFIEGKTGKKIKRV